MSFVEQEKSIIVSNLTKSFNSYKKTPGLAGSLKSFIKRSYITKTAVDSFSFEANQGEIIGLLGPNGAGKTTLMKMFTGIVVPSSGELKILGSNPWKRDKEFRKNIALVMGQKSQLWWDLPAMDSFHLLQKYYEIDNASFEKKIEEMGTILNLKDLFHIQVRKLSLGERMKMELMASLLHSPKVIFLDEPTIGLDLIAQENIRGFLKDYHKKNNTTIIITSHYMADVQALCSRLILIFDGKKSFDGPLERFENILGKEKNVTFDFESAQNKEDSFLSKYHAVWNSTATSVELRILEKDIRSVSSQILNDYNVNGFQTEKMPIERVMKTLMENPDILRG